MQGVVLGTVAIHHLLTENIEDRGLVRLVDISIHDVVANLYRAGLGTDCPLTTIAIFILWNNIEARSGVLHVEHASLCSSLERVRLMVILATEEQVTLVVLTSQILDKARVGREVANVVLLSSLNSNISSSNVACLSELQVGYINLCSVVN